MTRKEKISMKSDKHIVRSYRPYGIKVIHDDDDDLRFADPYADSEEPEYFRKKRNYITGDQVGDHAD